MNARARTAVSVLVLVCTWVVIVFSAYAVVVAEEQSDVRIFDNPGAEEQPARGNFVPLEKFEGSAKLSNAYGSEGLSDFLNKLFLGAMSLGAILAVLRLAWAGFQYMASDLWANKQHAKEIIQETLLGLFLLLGISLILNQINPKILELDVGIKALPSQTSTGNTAPGNTLNYPPTPGFINTPPRPPPARDAPIGEGEIRTYTDGRQIPENAWCYSVSSGSQYYTCTDDASSCGDLARQNDRNSRGCAQSMTIPDAPANLPDTTPQDCTVSGGC